MTAYEYIRMTLTAEQVSGLAKAGLIAPNTAQYIIIYEWHLSNGRSKKKTAQHFGMKPSTVGYAISQMKKQI